MPTHLQAICLNDLIAVAKDTNWEFHESFLRVTF